MLKTCQQSTSQGSAVQRGLRTPRPTCSQSGWHVSSYSKRAAMTTREPRAQQTAERGRKHPAELLQARRRAPAPQRPCGLRARLSHDPTAHTERSQHSPQHTGVGCLASRFLPVHGRQGDEGRREARTVADTCSRRCRLFCRAAQAHRNQQSPSSPCFTCPSCGLSAKSRGEAQIS